MMKQTKIAFQPELMERLKAYVKKKNRPEWSIASTVRHAVRLHLDSVDAHADELRSEGGGGS